MPLVKIKDKGQLTLPATTRARYGLGIGDYMEVVEEQGSIRLVPQEVAPRHPAIDAALTDALKDERSGRVTPPFKSLKEYRAWRKTPEGKKFAQS